MKELIEKERLNKLLSFNETYVIAVSTGIDSMSLLDFLHKKGYKLVIAHINHKRRIESDTEYDFLKGWAEENKVPFEGYVIRSSIFSNFQMEARNIRYRFFREVAKKYNTNKIITAHQADDLTETIMFRLLRGTSLKGYAGIKDINTEDGYSYIKPLLHTKRSEIEEYQKENNVIYFNDSSNDENHYTRNKIRHNIIPKFNEINSSYYNSIKNFSEDMIDVYNHIRKLSDEFIKEFADVKNESVKFPFIEFNKLDRAIKKEVIIESINIVSLNSVEVPHERINKILEVVDDGEYREIEIKDSYCCYFEYGNLTFKKKEQINKINISFPRVGEYYIGDSLKVLLSKNVNALPSLNSYMLCYNSEDEIFPITLRNVEVGDKITINNRTKKVYDVLKEHKIPKSERENILVFLNENGLFFIPNILRKETDQNKNNKIYITVYEVKKNDEE